MSDFEAIPITSNGNQKVILKNTHFQIQICELYFINIFGIN
ncbi:hypothetical protein FLBR109950_12775 [Flavobacterium branchiophilum]